MFPSRNSIPAGSDSSNVSKQSRQVENHNGASPRHLTSGAAGVAGFQRGSGQSETSNSATVPRQTLTRRSALVPGGLHNHAATFSPPLGQRIADIELPALRDSGRESSATEDIRFPAQGNNANRAYGFRQLAAAQAMANVDNNTPAGLILNAVDGEQTIRLQGMEGGDTKSKASELAALKQAKTDALFSSAAMQKWADTVRVGMSDASSALTASNLQLKSIASETPLSPDLALNLAQTISLLDSIQTKTAYSSASLLNVNGVFEEALAIQATESFLNDFQSIPQKLNESVVALVSAGVANTANLQMLADKSESLKQAIDNLSSLLTVKNITG